MGAYEIVTFLAAFIILLVVFVAIIYAIVYVVQEARDVERQDLNEDVVRLKEENSELRAENDKLKKEVAHIIFPREIALERKNKIICFGVQEDGKNDVRTEDSGSLDTD